MRVRVHAALAVILAALASVGAAHTARSDERLSATDAANALRCDERLVAIAATARLMSDEPATDACGDVATEKVARAGTVLPRAAHATGSPALHTAAARTAHHRLRHGALALRHAGRKRAIPELHAHVASLPRAGGVPVPAVPARESHPRATLPVLVRTAQHTSWGAGSRLAAALPRSSAALPVSATTMADEAGARAPDAKHEANEARGPPRPGRIALTSPAFARSLSFHPLARSPRPTSISAPEARSSREPARRTTARRTPLRGPDRDAVVLCARVPARGPSVSLVNPVQPLGRADVRRRESAAACPSGLSTGGGPCTVRT